MAEVAPLRPAVSRATPIAGGDLRAYSKRVTIAVAIVAAFVLAALAVWAGRSALLLIYVSVLIATGLFPMILWIERAIGKAVPRWAIIGVVYLAFLGVVITAALLIVPTMIAQAEELTSRLPSIVAGWQSGLVKHGVLARPLTVADAVQQSGPIAESNSPVALAASALRRLAGDAFEAVMVLIMTFYVLVDGPRMAGRFLHAAPARYRARVTLVAHDVTHRISAWLQGNLILGAIMGSATALAMGVLGVPYFWVVALVAAVGEAVPIAGPLIAGLFGISLALTVSPKLALIVGGVFLVLHEVEANVLIPRVMSRQVGLSWLTVFVALLLGGEWFGLIGAILAIPTAAIMSAVIEELGKNRVDQPAALLQRR